MTPLDPGPGTFSAPPGHRPGPGSSGTLGTDGEAPPRPARWKRVCEFCGETYINRGFHDENVCPGPERYRCADPKPTKRIVDGTAMPLDSSPIDENFCPICRCTTFTWQRHHVVNRSQGGDDVPENLVWLCQGCHDRLHRGGEWNAISRFIRYCRQSVPELGAYADARKYPGWLEERWGA